MNTPSQDILAETADYYSAKLAEYGATARGVDWNGEESQTLRFAQLTQVIDRQGFFSVNDLGCGYGAFLDYLQPRFGSFDYHGYDVSETMIAAALSHHNQSPCAHFITASEPTTEADFSIASGIFNVRLERSDEEWMTHIESTLESLYRTSRRGFAFNCLTAYSDTDKMKPYLYYADPCRLFDLCKRRFSRHVALLHDYPLYEFSIIVRKLAG